MVACGRPSVKSRDCQITSVNAKTKQYSELIFRQGFSSQCPPPVMYFLHQGQTSNFLQTASLTREQVFKYLQVWWCVLLQTASVAIYCKHLNKQIHTDKMIERINESSLSYLVLAKAKVGSQSTDLCNHSVLTFSFSVIQD